MKTVDLSLFNNNSYKQSNKIIRTIWYVINRIVYNSAFPYPNKIKRLILRLFGAKIGSFVIIKPKISIKYPWLLSISDNVWIGENVWIDNLAQVTIESNVCISQGAMLLCGNHDYKKSSFDLIVGDISLEKGVWIGAKAIVCPGVTCKSHSILAVGSVATRDLEPYSIYQGNPAVKIRNREIG